MFFPLLAAPSGYVGQDLGSRILMCRISSEGVRFTGFRWVQVSWWILASGKPALGSGHGCCRLFPHPDLPSASIQHTTSLGGTLQNSILRYAGSRHGLQFRSTAERWFWEPNPHKSSSSNRSWGVPPKHHGPSEDSGRDMQGSWESAGVMQTSAKARRKRHLKWDKVSALFYQRMFPWCGMSSASHVFQ